MIKVMADCINGVYEVEDFEGVEVTKDENLFYEELATCDCDEELACEISEDMYRKIDAEYGVTRSM